MPTSKDAIKRHIMYCLTAAETANNFYLDEKTREKGVKVFDGIREQVDLAMKRSEQLIPTNETDIILARFVDAVSQIGMIRYGVQGTLIPLAK